MSSAQFVSASFPSCSKETSNKKPAYVNVLVGSFHVCCWLFVVQMLRVVNRCDLSFPVIFLLSIIV